jgi:hypothetical protein
MYRDMRDGRQRRDRLYCKLPRNGVHAFQFSALQNVLGLLLDKFKESRINVTIVLADTRHI